MAPPVLQGTPLGRATGFQLPTFGPPGRQAATNPVCYEDPIALNW
jgi:hypothetical protein